MTMASVCDPRWCINSVSNTGTALSQSGQAQLYLAISCWDPQDMNNAMNDLNLQ